MRKRAGAVSPALAFAPLPLQEHTFTTVEGPRIPLPLKRGGSEN